MEIDLQLSLDVAALGTSNNFMCFLSFFREQYQIVVVRLNECSESDKVKIKTRAKSLVYNISKILYPLFFTVEWCFLPDYYFWFSLEVVAS